jgi:hypothetical protein
MHTSSPFGCADSAISCYPRSRTVWEIAMSKAKTAVPTAQPATIPDDEPQLIVDREFKSPRPLDRNISTVSLKTTTNNVSEGYDLQLSCTFGKERITLVSEEFVIDVDFSMNKANIELSFQHCNFAEINDTPRVEEYHRTISEHAGKHSSALAKLAGHLSLGPTGAAGHGRADATVQRSAASSTVTKQQIVRHDWHRLGSDAIAVGPTGHHLQGPMITDLRGWRVTPHDTDRVSGVIARVKVRETWLNFDNVQFVKSPAGLMDKVRKLMTDPQSKRKQYFNLLLRHLVQTELRDHQDGTDATIASHVLLVRPHHPNAMSPNVGASRRQIAIDGNRVAQWFAAEEGHEVGALIALGLRADIISPVAGDDEPGRTKRGSTFIPESSPRHAATTFELIHRLGSMPKDKVPHRTTLHDLRALKLVGNDQGSRVQSLVKPGLDANVVIRRAVSEMECIRVARQVLRINPTASPIEIAEAVALETGKNWPTLATKRRNGNAILSWMIWLEPYLLDANVSSEMAARIAYATDGAPIVKGRPNSLRKALEPELRQMLAQRLAKMEIARRLKVSPATIHNWIRKLEP